MPYSPPRRPNTQRVSLPPDLPTSALACLVWLLLPAVADWRWRRTGKTSPWYATTRLFRQSARRSRGSVLDAVAAALAEQAARAGQDR